MSKTEILAELSKLELADRREIFDRLCEIEERELIRGGGATVEEKALLDRELEEFRCSPEAGSSWKEVEARFQN